MKWKGLVIFKSQKSWNYATFSIHNNIGKTINQTKIYWNEKAMESDVGTKHN